MLSKDERKAEQALALYAAALAAKFRTNFKLVAAADAKFHFQAPVSPC